MRNPSRSFIKSLEAMVSNTRLSPTQRLKAAELVRDFHFGITKMSKKNQENEENLKKLLEN